MQMVSCIAEQLLSTCLESFAVSVYAGGVAPWQAHLQTSLAEVSMHVAGQRRELEADLVGECT